MKNPFFNAVAAALYIVVIVTVMNTAGSLFADTPDNILMPMVMLSLLVFSVALMGFLFAVQPLRLYLDNRREEAVTFFLKTLGTFACFIVVFVIALILAAR